MGSAATTTSSSPPRAAPPLRPPGTSTSTRTPRSRCRSGATGSPPARARRTPTRSRSCGRRSSATGPRTTPTRRRPTGRSRWSCWSAPEKVARAASTVRDWAMPQLEDTLRAQLLHSVSEAACAVTGARAASVALFDERTDDLVFVATAGEGADDVVGGHFPHDAGIAGQVLRTGEAVHVTDLWRDPRWARDIGAEAGYEPDAITAVPVVWHDRV